MSETIKAIGLNRLGLNESDFVFRNLPVETLVQDIIANNEGSIAANGAAMVDTGSYTGRSPTLSVFFYFFANLKKLGSPKF